MFKKKENKITRFFGGVAVGAGAGFLVGKLLSPSTVKSQTSKPKTLFKKEEKYSQDDNIHRSFYGNTHPHHVRSKSASRCEKKKKEQEVPATSTALNDSFTDNINDLARAKHSTNVQKIRYNNYEIYNISIEDNTAYLPDEVLSDSKEKENNSAKSAYASDRTISSVRDKEHEFILQDSRDSIVDFKNEMFRNVTYRQLRRFSDLRLS